MADRYNEAVAQVLGQQVTRHTTSFVSRTLGVGYNEAARYTLRMEADGILSEPNRVGVRTILPSAIDPAVIAAKLTKAQRQGILRLSRKPIWNSEVPEAEELRKLPDLVYCGLASSFDRTPPFNLRLTPLGLAVKASLESNQ